MSKMHKISVITISYNQGEYIEETLLSVFNQNYENLEYILIDGGSTDNSLEIIKKYEDKITYWVSEPDKGPTDALNKGFEKATGEILYYLNSDDIICPGSLAYFNDVYNKNPNFDVYYGHGFAEMPNINKMYKLYSDKWSLPLFLKGQIMIDQPSTFFKGSFYKNNLQFNLDNRTCWDGELIVDAAIRNARFFRFNKHVSVFRLYPESISGGNDDKRNKRHKERLALINEKIRKAGTKELNLGYWGLKLFKFLRDPVVMFKRLFALNSKKIKAWKTSNMENASKGVVS